MTKKQIQQFNKMLATLKKIAKEYQTPSQLRRNCEKQYGLGYEESLEMAYENLQSEAAFASRGVRMISDKNDERTASQQQPNQGTES